EEELLEAAWGDNAQQAARCLADVDPGMKDVARQGNATALPEHVLFVAAREAKGTGKHIEHFVLAGMAMPADATARWDFGFPDTYAAAGLSSGSVKLGRLAEQAEHTFATRRGDDGTIEGHGRAPILVSPAQTKRPGSLPALVASIRSLAL